MLSVGSDIERLLQMLVRRCSLANGTLLFMTALLFCGPETLTEASSGQMCCNLLCKKSWYREGQEFAQALSSQDSHSHRPLGVAAHRRHMGSQVLPTFIYFCTISVFHFCVHTDHNKVQLLQDGGASEAYNDIHQPKRRFQWVWQDTPSRFTVLFTTTAHDYETGMIR